MYKPGPFWFSNRGYGVFLHTSAPVTCDFGATYVGATKLFMADEPGRYMDAGLWGVRLMFTSENPRECVSVMKR